MGIWSNSLYIKLIAYVIMHFALFQFHTNQDWIGKCGLQLSVRIITILGSCIWHTNYLKVIQMSLTSWGTINLSDNRLVISELNFINIIIPKSNLLKILFMTPGKFLDACWRLYIKVCWSVGRSVGRSPFYSYRLSWRHHDDSWEVKKLSKMADCSLLSVKIFQELSFVWKICKNI